MTAVKEEAMKMIDSLPEEQVKYVIQYIRNITFHINEWQKMDKMSAFKELNQMLMPLPQDFDYDKELAEAREEKYGNID